MIETENGNRKILHLDMDAFFVSVELLKYPELRGKPVIVGGKASRGVVSTCSYEARAYGIHSAMPSVQAQRLCPQAVWLDGDYKSYSYYSERVFQIMRRYSPLVVQLSIDEGRADLTGSELLFGPAPEIAHRILLEIQNELNLPASAGLANSGTAAKIAAELAKPSGLAVILSGHEQSFLSPLKIERIPGVGKKSLPRFHSLGYRTIGDLSRRNPDDLTRHFGKWAGSLRRVALGMPGEVKRHTPDSPSRSHEATFMVDITDPEKLRIEIRHLVEKLGFRLRQEALKARTISVKIRDGRFNTITRSYSFDRPVDSDRILFQTAVDLITNNLPAGIGVRLIGVAAHQLSSAHQQLDLFGSPNAKLDNFYKTVDQIKEKFGKKTVGFGNRN
jgi:DNA polymerase IV